MVVDGRGDLDRIAGPMTMPEIWSEGNTSSPAMASIDGGTARSEQRFDARGNMTELRHSTLTDDGEQGGTAWGAYDERGLLTETRYLDAAAALAIRTVGGTDRGRTRSAPPTGQAENPRRRRQTGRARAGCRLDGALPHDNRGYLTAMEFFEPPDKPAAFEDGFQRAEFACDLRGNPVRESFFGAQSEDAPSSIERSYDERTGYHRDLLRCGKEGSIR